MDMTLDRYLIIINIVGFAVFAVNALLYRVTESAQIDILVTLAALAGGSLGIVLAVLLFNREAKKGNMMSRVFLFSILTIQVIIVLWIKGVHGDTLNFAFWEFFAANKIALIYLIALNVVTFIVYAWDKQAAIRGRSRIRIVTLLLLAGAGGSIGALLAIYILRHKTQKDYFTVGVPLIILAQIFIVLFVMNAE